MLNHQSPIPNQQSAIPDLLSVVLTLRSVPRSSAPGGSPAWWGRASHALLLGVIGRADAALAATLHEGDGPKPFTVSSLLGRFPDRDLDPTGSYVLRLTAIERRVARVLLEAIAEGGPLAAGALLELDYRTLRVEAATWDGEVQPWAGSAAYDAFAASHLAAAEPPDRQVTLQFTSPTAFRTQGRHMPLPLPDLVFGSLAERWNAFAPVAFPAEVRRYAAECLAISRFDLSSRATPGKEGGLRVGGVGQITYATLNYDRYWMSLLHALAAFALFSGVGVSTALGMGQCRKIED